MLHQKRQDWTVPHAPTKNSALLYRKLRDWTVPHSLSDIKTLFHPNRELWPPKKEKRTVSQPNCSLYTTKDQPCLEHASLQRTLLCVIEKDDRTVINSKLKCPIRQQDMISSQQRLWLPKMENRTVSQANCLLFHPNREQCIVISKKTKLNRSPSQ